jgi:hypothetical protein
MTSLFLEYVGFSRILGDVIVKSSEICGNKEGMGKNMMLLESSGVTL